MKFRPYKFSHHENERGSLTHEIRDYVRTGETRIVSVYKSKLDGRREVVKRTTTEFLAECTDQERHAFDCMIVGSIQGMRHYATEMFAARTA